jgi:hypothetical protein
MGLDLKHTQKVKICIQSKFPNMSGPISHQNKLVRKGKKLTFGVLVAFLYTNTIERALRLQ